VKPSALNPAVPTELERIVLKALEKDRAARYQSASALLADLEHLERSMAAVPRTRRWLLASSGATLATLAGGAFLTRRYILAPKRKTMLAFLPLEDLNADPKQAYFAEGLHEEMISIVGRLYPDSLGVIGSSSVKQYTGTNRKVDQIARDLKVDYLVEGGVQRDGDRVRITARLVRAEDQAQIWSATYDRDLRQILAIQTDIAQAVAQGIGRSLRPSAQVRLALTHPLNPEAYEAYLRGEFQKSIQADPTYAPAHAGRASNLYYATLFGRILPVPGFTSVMESAAKAVELDPTLAAGHAFLALGKLHLQWRWAEAEEGEDIGRALAPEEESALLAAAAANSSPFIDRFIRIALTSAMRAGEIRTLQVGRVNFADRTLTVGRSKSKRGTGRVIPLNGDLCELLAEQTAWLGEKFGKVQPGWYLFPFYDHDRRPSDPTRPVTTVKSAWEGVRTTAGVSCRFHDLRHTAITKLAEQGVPDSTMKALAGHVHEKMLERYSHIRMAAKREAVEALALPKVVNANGVPKESPKVSRKSRLSVVPRLGVRPRITAHKA
jgi:TolB-like protein/integrase